MHLDNAHGGIAHCILRKGKTSRAVKHKTVSEFWYILSGKGQMWRSREDKTATVDLAIGISIEIPAGTAFQYRSLEEDLVFLCITMPPWPGPTESVDVTEGAWPFQ